MGGLDSNEALPWGVYTQKCSITDVQHAIVYRVAEGPLTDVKLMAPKLTSASAQIEPLVLVIVVYVLATSISRIL